jgi:diguanylate cyclase (GGDEF)-like protein
VRRPISTPPGHTDRHDPRIQWSWWTVGGIFLALGLIAGYRLIADAGSLLDWLVLTLVVAAGAAAIVHRNAVASLEAERRTEAESFARILSALSRSVSPDAVVDAIVKELAEATGADHVVVARRRPGSRVLDATLVSSRPGVPDSTMILPLSDLEERIDWAADRQRVEAEPVAIPIEAEPVAVTAGGGVAGPAPAMPPQAAEQLSEPVTPADEPGPPVIRVRSGSDSAQHVADRIATRVRRSYGLRDTIAAPLVPDGEVVGAIVLSRRVADPWPATARRLLDGAAREASTALSRAYSHRAAEARASVDALTGLPNRRYFDEFCGLLARRRRADDAVGVLMIDIDRFKDLNDRYGHAVGDEVLREVGGAIVAAVRDDDVPARYGGEEFVVLLRNPSRTVAIDVGERVRSAVGSLDLRGHGVPRVSVSVGVAVASFPDQPIDSLLAEADGALYRAKRAGRDRVVAA